MPMLVPAPGRFSTTTGCPSPSASFADSAERIQSLRSFRLGILPGSPATLLLAATFDRAWEPYMRLIWSPLGPMLDVIFCNCEGYVAARVFAEGLKRAGRNPTREALVVALESIQQMSFGGFQVGFGPRDHVASRFVDLSMLTEDGRVRH